MHSAQANGCFRKSRFTESPRAARLAPTESQPFVAAVAVTNANLPKKACYASP